MFLYSDPIGKIRRNPADPLVPVQILKVTSPKWVGFSPESRFVAVENADKFAVYDAETDRGYVYATDRPLDKPQTHSAWIDDFRLTYVSGGKVAVFDFDGTNLNELLPADPNYLPFFDHEQRYLYGIGPKKALIRAPLFTPQDL